jgi:hypothetical protein
MMTVEEIRNALESLYPGVTDRGIQPHKTLIHPFALEKLKTEVARAGNPTTVRGRQLYDNNRN